VSRRDDIKNLFAIEPANQQLATANPRSLAAQSIGRVAAGPVRSMGLAFDKLEEESRALQDALAKGATIVELDPGAIDPSFVKDRLSGVVDEDFDALKRSIEEHGQETPILVRPHPDVEGRYQIAYGHRRLLAAVALGRKIKAVVRTLSDIELVVAQGLENSARRDLSYIERAIFAARLEDMSFDRDIIMKALSTDKTELSKLISVGRSIPEPIVESIGAAPKAGRRRWMTLAELLKTPKALRAAKVATKNPDFAHVDSDARFQQVLRAVSDISNAKPVTSIWKTPEGDIAAKITRARRSLTVAIDQTRDTEFGEYVVAQLDGLYKAFQSLSKTGD
jgi:ParB family transcriptional regulator, chromosome partitioning protein